MKKILFIIYTLTIIAVIPFNRISAERISSDSIIGRTNICDLPQPVPYIGGRSSVLQRPYNVAKRIEQSDTYINRGIPFGFWGLNGYTCYTGFQDVKSRFKATVFQVLSDGPNYNINTLLPAVKDAGMKINLNITGNYSNFADDEGNFDIALWKAALDDYFNDPDTAVAMQEYIDNKTIVGVMLLDDIYNFTGADPTAEELEQMACDIDSYINVTTWFREDIDENLIIEDPSFQFSCLDAVGLQYSARKGSIENYIDEQQLSADNLNLKIVAGLNIADGGDGSSGQQGWGGPGFYAMSAEEITEYGEAMLDMENLIMFLMWEYDAEEKWPDGSRGSNYFDQPDLQRAIYNLGLKARRYSNFVL
jgi:hypothetical protein